MKMKTMQEGEDFITYCEPETEQDTESCKREIQRQLVERGDKKKIARDVRHSSHGVISVQDEDTTRFFRLRVVAEEVPET